ncbi:zinc finger protein 431-like [Sabethes cyaneus]|uniref:zinc finger protein 431-like n=1 Tax=Sabethes cyaneus TaxID=53552 RepID=UPI00237E3B2A|nr:zinc finger protein 431-like [Sabethes cyaneus]
MPCIVPTCLRTDEKMISFPDDRTLAARWFTAIEVGCGHSMQLAEPVSNPEVCSSHFIPTGSDIFIYEEPSRFLHRDETCTQISSCRACLAFHPSEDMVSLEDSIGEKSIAYLLEMLDVSVYENNFLKLICLSCIAQIEIFTALRTKFTQSELAYKELLQKSRNVVQYFDIKVEVDSEQVAMVEEETLMQTSMKAEFDVNQDSYDDEYKPVPSRNRSSRTEKRRRGPKKRNSCKLTSNENEKQDEQISLKKKMERKCYICNTVLPDANQLLVHLTKTHPSKTGYKCDECSLEIPLLYAYNRHLSRHDKSERPLKCTMCPMRFVSHFQLKLHENKLHGAKHDVKRGVSKARVMVCDQCGKVSDNRSIKEHIRQVHQKESQPTCNICEKTFTTKPSLERHMLLHTNAKPYSCEQCDATFRRLLDYRHHKSKVHDGVNPHVCSECNQEFKSYQQLYGHKQRVHRNKIPAYQYYQQYETCKLCRLRFAKSGELVEHVQKQHADEQYPMHQCPHCPKTFMMAIRLATHKLIHSDKYVCKECGARQVSAKKLQYHMDVKHPVGRVYTCSGCPRTFTSLHQLTLHSTIHTRGKQFQCDFCTKSFLRKCQLVIHIRTHTGEKPFQCEGCSKRFSDDGTFCKHKKRCQALLARTLAKSEYEEN